MPNVSYTQPLPPSEKTTQQTICYLMIEKKKDEIMKPLAQNNTFAIPDTQADASACKRAISFPTHYSK